MDTIRLTGLRPLGGGMIMNGYANFRVDAELQLDLRAQVAGDSQESVDVLQIAQRLAYSLRSCTDDINIVSNPTITLPMIAGHVLDSAMRSWQIRQAHITLHAQPISQENNVFLDDISVTLHRVADDCSLNDNLQVSKPSPASLVQYEANQSLAQFKNSIQATSDNTDTVACEPSDVLRHTVLIALRGIANNHTRSAMLHALASFETASGMQVDGVSALYQVNGNENDLYSIVLALSTSNELNKVVETILALEAAQENTLKFRIIGVRDYGSEPSTTTTFAPEHVGRRIAALALRNPGAAELEPWLQLEPQACLDGDPLAYLLAFAGDSMHVGLYAENWIMGDCS